jgi:outer membrane lipopolysaccharide assembly protein LptE/RlpB
MSRNLMRLGAALVLAVSLGGCGYHLAGQGDAHGAIPPGTQTVVVRASGLDANRLAQELMARMRVGSDYTLQRADAPHATGEGVVELRIENASVSFVPAAYDRTGIAIQYRLTLSASLSLYRGQTALWQSGPMAAGGDVYVTGSPASVEASRDRVAQEMRRQWARQAWERLQSGF